MDAEISAILRLLAAVGAGIALGFAREMVEKPIGMRTLALAHVAGTRRPV